MSTWQLDCTYDTYIAPYTGETGNNDSSTRLRTYSWNDGTNVRCAPFLQFEITNGLQYKKITKAVLHYYLTLYSGEYGSYAGCDMRSFSASANISSVITYSGYNSYGGFSTAERQVFSGGIYSGNGIWCEQDVTNFITNNIYDNYLTLCPTMLGSNNLAIASVESGNGAYLQIEYEDVLPSAPTLLYPVNVYVRQDSVITMRWNFNSESGAHQKTATIEYRKYGNETWNILASLTQIDTFYYVPSNTFDVGVIEWRVKATDELDQESDYGTGSFVVTGKPAYPVFTTIKNDALTEIDWNASDQNAFKIQIFKDGKLILEDEQHTNHLYYKPKMFLQNGTYEVRLNIMNSYDMWSGYTSKIFVLNAPVPYNVAQITVSYSGDHVEILSSLVGEVYLYRTVDGESTCIAKMDKSNMYTDYFVRNGERTGYFLRTHLKGISDCQTKYIIPVLNGFSISDSTKCIEILKSTDQFIPFSEYTNVEMELNEFDGREHPVAEFGDHTEHSITRKCYLTEEQYALLRDMMLSRTNLVYKDDRSRLMTCNVSSLPIDNRMKNGYTATIKLTEVDREEGVTINA